MASEELGELPELVRSKKAVELAAWWMRQHGATEMAQDLSDSFGELALPIASLKARAEAAEKRCDEYVATNMRQSIRFAEAEARIATLETEVAQAREKALREAAGIAERAYGDGGCFAYGDEGKARSFNRACNRIENQILGLIPKP